MAGKEARSGPTKSWQGRLAGQADAATAEFVASLDVDRALWRYDIVGSVAHAQMLCEVKLISKADLTRIDPLHESILIPYRLLCIQIILDQSEWS